MSARILVIILTITLTACTKQYLVATNFNEMLYTGMTRTEFDVQWHGPTKAALRGNLGYETKRFFYNGDTWEVLSYSVYDYNTIDNENPVISHKEFVAFRNGHLEDTGRGVLPPFLENKQTLR